jgi:multidrug resistance efflux pump
MSRTRLIVLVVAVAVVGAVAWLVAGGGALPGQAGASPSPTVGPVAESTTVAADVRAVPVRRAELAAPGAGGVVAEVLVAEGDRVTQGQPLLRLEGAQAEAALAEATAATEAAQVAVKQADGGAQQAGAEVDAARAAVDQAEAAVDVADATRDGTPSGGSAGAADAEVDRARAAVRVARAQLDSARAAAQAAEAAIGAARLDLERADAAQAGAQAAVDDLTLTAPFAGTVASLDAVVGETVAAGTPVARVADPAGWRFETIDLDEAAIGRLAVGADATITVDAFADVAIPARIVSISPFGESSAGDVVYTVVLEPGGDAPEGCAGT